MYSLCYCFFMLLLMHHKHQANTLAVSILTDQTFWCQSIIQTARGPGVRMWTHVIPMFHEGQVVMVTWQKSSCVSGTTSSRKPNSASVSCSSWHHGNTQMHGQHTNTWSTRQHMVNTLTHGPHINMWSTHKHMVNTLTHGQHINTWSTH